MTLKKVGIGIIGTGFARRVQIPGFLLHPSAFIASVSSGSLENAQNTADEFGIGHVSGDWRETVAHPDVELVCITTPPIYHREMTLAAVEHGKHVLCEKPMAMNVAEAAEMTQVAANKGILALIDHELRFQPGRRRAYEMLREGVIGEIRHGKAFFQAPHRGDPNVAWNWWSDEAVGGGALGAIGSHIIDSFNWFLGTEIKSLSCQLQTHIKQRRDAKGELREVTSDDEANMLLRFADSELTADATGIVSISMTENPIYQNTMEFYGTRGSMRIAHRGEPFIARSGDQDWQEISVDLGRQIPGIPDTGFARAFMEFGPIIVDAILDGQTEIENAATFRDGLETQRVLDAARQSDKSGSAVIIER